MTGGGSSAGLCRNGEDEKDGGLQAPIPLKIQWARHEEIDDEDAQNEAGLLMPNRRYTRFSQNKISGSPKRPTEAKPQTSFPVNVKQSHIKPNLPGKASNGFSGFKSGSKQLNGYANSSGI